MWRMSHVLIVDSSAESCRRSMFLLHLAGVRVTCTPSVAEACNRVRSYHSVGEKYQLMLIAEELTEAELDRLTEECAYADFPKVLLVDRSPEEDFSPHSTRLNICRPDNMIQTAIQLINSGSNLNTAQQSSGSYNYY